MKKSLDTARKEEEDLKYLKEEKSSGFVFLLQKHTITQCGLMI
jgi:hypothetical protein